MSLKNFRREKYFFQFNRVGKNALCSRSQTKNEDEEEKKHGMELDCDEKMLKLHQIDENSNRFHQHYITLHESHIFIAMLT